MIEIISQKVKKAKKEHTCDWCQCKIDKGEEYQNTTLKFNDLYIWKSHLHCTKIYQELKMDTYDGDGVDSDTFMEFVYEFLYKNLNEEENDEIDTHEKAIETTLRLLQEVKYD